MYLLIENDGAVPPECLTMIGMSFADMDYPDAVADLVIGRFGSGTKYGITACLRDNKPPIIYSSNLRMEFGSSSREVTDGIRTKETSPVTVKYAGSHPFTKKKYNRVEDLGLDRSYGHSDWTTVMAVREFVSNALDRSFLAGGENWRRHVDVSLVQESQIKPRRGWTRVFIPADEIIMTFLNSLGKWFLHFSEPHNLRKSILAKGHNLHDRQTAVVYRRGVHVREYRDSSVPSMFDYNLNNLPMTESRVASDHDMLFYCAREFTRAPSAILAQYLRASLDGREQLWEDEFSRYGLRGDDSGKAKTAWLGALAELRNDRLVIADENEAGFVAASGFKPLTLPRQYVDVLSEFELPTTSTRLTEDARAGRQLGDAPPAVFCARDALWSLMVECNLVPDGMVPPELCCYHTNGIDASFLRKNRFYINADLVGDGNCQTFMELPAQLQQTMVGLLAEYITGGRNNSSDVYTFMLKLLCRTYLREPKRAVPLRRQIL